MTQAKKKKAHGVLSPARVHMHAEYAVHVTKRNMLKGNKQYDLK